MKKLENLSDEERLKIAEQKRKLAKRDYRIQTSLAIVSMVCSIVAIILIIIFKCTQ